VPLTGHLWPLATHHRGLPSGPTGEAGPMAKAGAAHHRVRGLTLANWL